MSPSLDSKRVIDQTQFCPFSISDASSYKTPLLLQLGSPERAPMKAHTQDKQKGRQGQGPRPAPEGQPGLLNIRVITEHSRAVSSGLTRPGEGTHGRASRAPSLPSRPEATERRWHLTLPGRTAGPGRCLRPTSLHPSGT